MYTVVTHARIPMSAGHVVIAAGAIKELGNSNGKSPVNQWVNVLRWSRTS